MKNTKAITKECPECGCSEFETDGALPKTHRGCIQCGQEWFSDIDYKTEITVENPYSLERFNVEIPKGWTHMQTGRVSKHDKLLTFLNGVSSPPTWIKSSYLNIGENVNEFLAVIILADS